MIAVLAVAVLAWLAVLAVSALRRVDPGSCTTTKAVVADTVPVLEHRFQLVELTYACHGPLGSIAYDGASISLTAPAGRRSARLARDVRAQLDHAGWTASHGSARLVRHRGHTSYSASVAVNSTAPALAIVTLLNARPSFDTSIEHVKGALAAKALSDRQKLRYVTVSAFVPRFVPAGYARWEDPRVLSYHDVASNLIGTSEVAPSLRSQRLPAHYSARACDVFAAASADGRCALFGTTRSGVKVYIAHDPSSPDGLAGNPVAVVSGTLVTLLHGHDHPYVQPPLRRADVLAIFGSLRARNVPAAR